MPAIRASTGRRILILGVLILLGSGALLRAVDPDTAAAKKADEAKPEPGAKPAEKTFKFEFRGKAWRDVLEWFSDISGLPYIGSNTPTGTFTFISPKTGPREYTIPQIIDILNEALLAQKYILIRKIASFTLIPADEKINPAELPRIRIEDLDQRGNTELASVVLPLSSLVAEDLAPEVKKMMGPFGEVVAITVANQLLLQDTAGNLKRVVKTIKDIEEGEKDKADSFSHTCKYIKARDAERILKELLGDPRDGRDGGRSSQPQFDRGMGFPFDRGGPSRGSGFPIDLSGMLGGPSGFQQRGGDQQRGGGGGISSKLRMHYISCDERTNTVLVTGPANKTAQAREIMKRLDIPTAPGQPPRLPGGELTLKTYQVTAGTADAVAKTLQEHYKNSNSIRISAINGGTIMVMAYPDDQFDIARHILGNKERAEFELLPLQNLEAAKVADTLKAMFGDSKAGAPYIEADSNRNAIMVKGSTDQVADVKAALKALGEGGGQGGNIRIITLKEGSAATMAEALQRMLSEMRKNPVKVITPGGESPKPEPPKEKPKGGDSKLLNPKVDQFLVLADDKQIVDPQKDKAKDERPGSADKPITITAFGNQLIVTSEDPAALALVQALIRIMQTPGGEGDFEVIKLKYANAVEAAKILDEMFNGVKANNAQQFQQGRGFGGGFGQFGQAQPAPANPATNRIRVVADSATNALLVRATPIDMLTIRRLLEKAIDIADVDSKQVYKTRMIKVLVQDPTTGKWGPERGPLKYANAVDVANVIREVYRESINNNPVGGSRTFVGFLGTTSRTPTLNLDPSGNPRGVSLSVAVDERNNSVIVNCTDLMFEDLTKLADELEKAAKETPRTVKFVSLKGLDPLAVQQAIDAIQGRRPTGSSLSGMGGMFGNNGMRGSNFVPFGASGMATPGMFQGGGFSPFRPSGGGFQPGGFSAPAGGSFQPAGSGSFQPGGGGLRGGSGGLNPSGGGFQPGSGIRGGGGGGRPPGRSAGSADGGGPDFFASRVMDDPQPTALFDPQQSEQVTDVAASEDEACQPVRFEEEEQQQPPPAGQPDLRPPGGPVNAAALEQLGGVVISGNDADVKAVLELIEFLQRQAQAQLQLVPLDHADATSVANILSQSLVGAAGNLRQPGQGQQGGLGAQLASSILLLPLPRYNSILVGAPAQQMAEVIGEIKKLDRPVAPQGGTTAFPLKKAAAARVAPLLQQFYAQRYANETTAQNQIRITFDDSTNTVYVQAAPADLAEIRGLIERLDTMESPAVNDMRIVPLRYALSDDLANLLLQAIAQGYTPATTTGAPGIVPGAAGGGIPGAGAAAGAIRPGGVGGVGGVGGLGAGGIVGVSGQSSSSKITSLRFLGRLPSDKGGIASGMLDDIRITSDPRTNSLILSAPAKTMDLLLALVRELDVPPAARAEVKIFTLKKADAVYAATLLQQLFLGTGGTGVGGVGALPGVGGIGGAGGAAAALTTAGAFGGAAGLPRPMMTLGGPPLEGPPLIDLRLTVDQRTNSVIVAGGRNDLEVIEAIISRLEDSDVPTRHNEVYKLKNASAPDVATALQNFLTRALGITSTAGMLTAYQELERDVVIVPEPISNTLLISATPNYYADIMRMICELDAQQPQVVIQVLIAEVDLTNTEEFGVEVGLQSPILFSRTVIPQTNAFGSGGSVTFTNLTSATAVGPGQVPPGVTVNTSMNPAAFPGFNFNTTADLGTNPLAGPGVVGYQGLGNLGVGRSSPNTNGVGGFIFSAASDSFSLLIRALKTQNRIDILSRPQVMTLDRQAATILIGQAFPYTTGTTSNGIGPATTAVNYRNIGVQLDVTPQISPDGKVLMRVTPQISSVQPNTISLGNGVVAPIFNVQTVDTTVLAEDGETVALGGLISKNDNATENKIPWFGDLPKIGALFRFRNTVVQRKELLVIMTPHIVRCAADADRILAEESRRIDWMLGDVFKTHATTGMDPILQGRQQNGRIPGQWWPDDPKKATPASDEPAKPDTLPPPRVLPKQTPQSQAPPANAPAPDAKTGGGPIPLLSRQNTRQ
jgi:type II secretion system protein D